jgi:glycerophosphoryl diester phosphodiesterase
MTLLFGHGPEDGSAHGINRLASFDWCRARGVDGIECDVRRTADDQLVVIHDAALADGRAIAATNRAELPVSIPSLDEVLDACRGLVVNVELKNFPRDPAFDPGQRVTRLMLELLAARGQADRVLVSCFDFAALDLVRAEAPQVATGMLHLSRRPAAELLDRVVDHGHTIVHPYDTMVDAQFMALARDRSLAVNVWLGDAGDARLRELVELDVDGLITSDVDAARLAIDDSILSRD